MQLLTPLTLCATTILLPSAAVRADQPEHEVSVQHAATANVTNALRVSRHSVSVRANPMAPTTPKPSDGQIAFIDENGRLTSTPPPGFQFPAPVVTRAAVLPRMTNTLDPNEIGIDTSSIQNYVIAHVDPAGRIELNCDSAPPGPVAEAADKPKGAADSGGAKKKNGEAKQ